MSSVQQAPTSTLVAPTQVGNEFECQLNQPIVCNGHGKPAAETVTRNAVHIPSEEPTITQAALRITRPLTPTQQGYLSTKGYATQIWPDSAYRDDALASAAPPKGALAQLLSAENNPSISFRPASAEASSLSGGRRPSFDNGLSPLGGVLMPPPLSSIGRGSLQDSRPSLMLDGSSFPALRSEYFAETQTTISTASLVTPFSVPPTRLSSTPTHMIQGAAAPAHSQLMNSAVLAPDLIPTGAMEHQSGNSDQRSSIASDVPGWGYCLPSDLIQHLETYPCFGDRSLALPRFRDYYGVYICPLCAESLCMKYFHTENRFAIHLKKDWSNREKARFRV